MRLQSKLSLTGQIVRSIIEHAQDPRALARLFEEIEDKSESEFEALVAK